MDIKQLVKNSKLYPALIIESWLGVNYRRLMIKLSAGLLIGLFGLATLSSSLVPRLAIVAPRIWGLVSLALAFYLSAKCLEWYFNSSYYFDNVTLNNYQPGDLFTFTVGRILMNVKQDDLLAGFLTSNTGKKIIIRLGLTESSVKEFLNHRPFGQYYKLPIEPDRVMKLRDLVSFLYHNDSTFSNFLAQAGINEEKLLGATAWVVFEIEYGEYIKRWWSKSNLSKLPGIAKDWGFGNTTTLDKYSWDLLFGLEFSTDLYEYSSRQEEIAQLENILSKQKEANVFLVADTANERLDLVWHLARRIRDGRASPSLEHKRPVLFNSAVFLSRFKERTELEQELLKIIKEVQLAGNVLLVFDNFVTLMRGFSSLQANFLDLLYPFLSSSRVQVIGLLSNDDYHREVESNSGLMAVFDRIFIRPLPTESVIRNLEKTIWEIESRSKVFFTYPALLAIVYGAERYFSTNDSGDKAVDLLTELVPLARGRGLKIINLELVEEILKSKTGVPVGSINTDERDKLLNLEKKLGERVIGQREALLQIANALRRSRAGIRNEKKPIGSFLFLGPTGVGKTETAKALAELMFAGEKNLLRLDMAEFQTPETADDLIGGNVPSEPGRLARLVRENPYGVLLLDEFEKAHSDIHDLFLTIFDEGYFTDKSGQQVNLRNMIIIATSNAGSDYIWNLVRSGQTANLSGDVLVNHLVSSALFKPELLNRFDSVVVYRPLLADELHLIAKLMLGKLAKRLAEKGITLSISDYLISAVAKLGANEVFGARPMQRYIQDNIEQQVADALVSGAISSGASISFVPEGEAHHPVLHLGNNIE